MFSYASSSFCLFFYYFIFFSYVARRARDLGLDVVWIVTSWVDLAMLMS